MQSKTNQLILFLINLLKWLQNSYFILLNPLFFLKHKHKCISFIMDGNRRYNPNNSKYSGLITLKNTINNCKKLKIKNPNFFVLSKKNLKRNESEFLELENVLINNYLNAKIVLVGDLDCLKEDFKSKVLNYVKRNNELYKERYVVRLFVCYDENSFFDEKTDLIIRTGDVFRLSGFLLRQASSGTKIHFLKAMWPQFNYSHLILSLIIYDLEEYLLKRILNSY